MKLPICPHAKERIEGALFKLVNGKLVMSYYCDSCGDEFYRDPIELETKRAKELGIIK